MNSMTGFGKAQGMCQAAGIGFRIEISSINRKQFELKCALPREISIFENDIRMLVSKKISRGSLLLRVALVFCGESAGQTGCSPAERFCRTARDLQEKCGLASLSDAIALLQIPIVAESMQSDFSDPETERQLLRITEEAVDDLIRMRKAEGDRLRPDLENRIGIMEACLTEIEPLVIELPKQNYDRLLARARDNGIRAEADDERFLRELVIFTDKSDVTEEIVRLKSHFAHFHSLLDGSGDEAVGRPLDFLTQEIFREVNTLGNKAPLPEVSRRIVAMKTEIEKIREQVQNVE